MNAVLDYTVQGVETSSGATLDLTGGTFQALNGTDTGGANDGKILIGNNSTFIVGPASGISTIPLDDVNLIELDSTGSPTILLLDAGGIADQEIDLTGGGKLTLSNNANNSIEDTLDGVDLDNENDTISGAGTIEIAELQNQNSGPGEIGVINANLGIYAGSSSRRVGKTEFRLLWQFGYRSKMNNSI